VVASVPARNSARSARRHSSKPRIAACIAPANPFRVPSAATDVRISLSEIAKRSARVFAAAVLMNGIKA
jgi:hypothetical protein